ncbi:MAG: hypothetical protein J0H15_07840 [Xanthomonadales bacterium]|nr:hypothetical protein [Xanthomonadales bacterium]
MDLADSDGEAERRAILEMFEASDAAPRIDALRDLPELAGRVRWLEQRLASVGEDERLYHRLIEAEAVAFRVRAQPSLIRDRRRQDGTRKPRRPDIDAWMDGQLRRDPDVKAPELWERAPSWIKDQVALDRFKKRVTDARKRAASK